MSVCALHCSGYPMNPVYSCNPSGVSMGRGQDFFAGSGVTKELTSKHASVLMIAFTPLCVYTWCPLSQAIF